MYFYHTQVKKNHPKNILYTSDMGIVFTLVTSIIGGLRFFSTQPYILPDEKYIIILLFILDIMSSQLFNLLGEVLIYFI